MSLPLNICITRLREAGVIPDVLPTGGTLLQSATIIWPGARVEGGEVVERVAVHEQPTVEFAADSEDSLYTIIMTDPDLMMTNDKLNGQVRHWIQPGVKFGAAGMTMTEPAITNYLPPSPGLGTGRHRYVFLIAKQPHPHPLTNALTAGGPAADLKSRMQFDAAQYVRDADLEVVGATFMYVQPDVGATVTDAKLMGESIAHAVVGK